MKFCLHETTGKTPLNIYRYYLTRYLTLSSRGKMLKEVRDWNRTFLWLHWQRNSWLGTGGGPDGTGSQRDSEWRTRRELYSMLFPSFLFWDSNICKEEHDKTNERTECQFRFSVAIYNTIAWSCHYVILCNHNRSISKWMTYTSRSFVQFKFKSDFGEIAILNC